MSTEPERLDKQLGRHPSAPSETAAAGSGKPADESPPKLLWPNPAALLANLDFPRLLRCPKCEYSLLGLSQSRHCPECGLEYDRYSCEWAGRHRSMWRTLAIVVLIALIWLITLLDAWSRTGRNSSWLLTSAWVVPLVLVFGYAYRMRAVNHRRAFLATTPHGIAVRLNRIKVTTIPWDATQGVAHGVHVPGLLLPFNWRTTLGRGAADPVLLYRGGLVVRQLNLRPILQTEEEVNQFVLIVEWSRRWYAQKKGSG